MPNIESVAIDAEAVGIGLPCNWLSSELWKRACIHVNKSVTVW